ncbi:MAG: ABC transporter ATP-binding protein [Desulfobacterales bacterium]|nr:ABC transporter ATP-binding protein [Desulfobacterales bacterium]MDD4072754.1 ABC transporter ATP-binding protein [Desulfobacterales bacterium]MDD4392470.1 ABC transporter ATP-binding protein [Desulfobacterales bacterium]
MPPILEVRNIVKTYGSVTAVDGVSFAIEQGTCFGLLGPNGAGKTTTIEVIEDITPPTSGEILYKGMPRSASFREEVGIQFQHTALLNFLTVRETLETFHRLFHHTHDLEELIDLCHLRDIQKQDNDKISGGQRQRLMMALALVNKPELMFLDEPSTGLDPQARQNLWEIIQNIKAGGKTIILTTHYMEEAQVLCDDVAIMDHGKIIARGTPEALIRTYCGGATLIIPKQNITVPMSCESFNYRELRNTIEIQTSDINACIREILSLGIDLKGMIIRTPNLENVFLNLTGRKIRE